jgi:hemerythrin-like domain-containing protein
MCDYCGCQDVPAIAVLNAEHDAIVNLTGEVHSALQAGRLDEAALQCRRILTILGPHTTVEEQGLFPAMRAEFTEQVDVLQAEHRAIEAVLAEADAGPPADPQWPQRLLAALHELREHILKEENGVFPASLAVLSAEDWEHLERVRASAPPALE